MTDIKGGYQRPTASSYVSSSWEDHKDRPTPSTEPGTDYGVAYGTTLYAPEDFEVIGVDHSNDGPEGRRLSLLLGDGSPTSSIHLSEIWVSEGQRGKRGDAVGKTGASAWGSDWGVGAHVHQTLWENMPIRFGTWATIDFEARVGDDNDGATLFDQTVALEQAFLNAAQGESLVVDGIFVETLPDGSEGKTKAAIKRYQTYLKGRGWYDGEIDGYWGGQTQAGHEKRYPEWVAETTPAPNPSYHTATVADLAELEYVNGLQKIAHLYGYGANQAQESWMDNRWGGGSQSGLQAFLDQNHGGSLATWLRSRWGYSDNDDLWGPNMRAAAVRAEHENFLAL
ncbi:M23 family metallopeptidase [Microbacterium rhizomatis]|uniref:M23 family metallopeptidase n=1 Tax=Microbacterium rhizomatis TaxID=1631477 RepID=A0A5J5J3Z0_9MICO|nr:M23 family metallopeptidase [Microbacterium rhizomatis]KAA9110169.1 M23 family metallopeptidase [Microbacterium rhizomatis]